MPLFTGLQGLPPLSLALEYARRGVAVFPVALQDKRPLTKTGFHAATTDTAQITRWWTTWPQAAVAAPAGPNNGFEVVDFDRKHGDPFTLLEELERLADCVLRGPRVLTQSQGLHIYVQATGRIRNSASKVLRGVDTRGEGGYVLLPGNPGYSLMLDGELEPPPESLVALFARAQGPALSVVTGGLSQIPYQRTTAEQIAEVTTPGRWHDSMVRITWAWVMRGFSRGEIADMAPFFRCDGYSVEQTVAEVLKMADAAYVKQSKDPRGDNAAFGSADEPLPLAPYNHADLAAIAPRRWVYSHFLLRGYVSVLGAPGGVGKTAYATSLALAIASGKRLLDQDVHEQGPVLFCNLEDDLDEMRRRVGAAMMLHKVKQDDIGNRLQLLSGRDHGLVVATLSKERRAVATPIVDRCIETIRQTGATLLIVDPFVASHELEENRNDQVNFAVAQWRRVAHESGASILLCHHFRKGGESGAQDAFRGASALIDAARAAVSLAVMDEEEADRLNIDVAEAKRMVRLDNAKLNVAPRPEEAPWFKLCGVTLPNGDNVQAVLSWRKPGLFGSMSLAHVNIILDAIAEGLDGEPYTRNPSNAGPRYAIWPIIRAAASCGADLTEGAAKAMLDRWLETGALEDREYQNKHRKWRRGVFVVDAKRPYEETF